MPKPRGSLKNVAERAGVSQASVSRYLNGSLSLPAATESRIRAAIDFFDYRPNLHARRLSLGRSDAIALVLPEIANPFFAELAAAAEGEAVERGLDVMLFATGNRPMRELDYLARLTRSDVDAVLFVTNHADAEGALAAAISRAKRIVLLDEDVPGAKVSKIFSDNEAGGRLAARAFLEAGHRRFAYIGGPRDLMSARERGAGFRETVRAAGLGATDLLEFYGEYTVAHGRAAAGAIFDAPARPTAVFASSDQILLGFLEVLRARGLHAPEHVSLVTFDDVAPLTFFNPPISAIRQAVSEMGRMGVERLSALILDDEAPVETLRLPIEFISRSSVAAPRPDGRNGRRQ